MYERKNLGNHHEPAQYLATAAKVAPGTEGDTATGGSVGEGYRRYLWAG